MGESEQPSEQQTPAPAEKPQQQQQQQSPLTPKEQTALKMVLRSLPVRGYLWVRNTVFDAQVLPNIKAEVIVTFIALVGIAAWFVKESIDERRENSLIRMQFTMARHEKREEAMREFAEGIPKNHFYLGRIRLMGLWLTYAYPDRANAKYFDGRTYPEVASEYREQMHQWQSTCPHYTALCEQVLGRFTELTGHKKKPKESEHLRRVATSDTVKAIDATFDELNALSLDEAEIKAALIATRERLEEVRKSVETWQKSRKGASQDEEFKLAGLSQDWQELIDSINQHPSVTGVTEPTKSVSERSSPAPTTAPGMRRDVVFEHATSAEQHLVDSLDLMQIMALRLMHVELATTPELIEVED